MVKRLKSFLAPPVFEDELVNRKAQLLNTILIAVIILLAILWFARLFSGTGQFASMAIIGGLDLFLVVLFFGMRRGRIEGVASLLVVVAWTAMSLLAWRADGAKDSAVQAYFVVILIASLLSGWRLALVITGLSIIAGWGFVYAESLGLIVPALNPSYDIMIDYTFIFGLGGVMVYLLINGLQKALKDARESNHTLQLLSQELEQRVQERTRDLALAAEVGRRISHAQDLDKLLAESVELIRERFQLYHVQVYLVDAANQNLNLRASTGSVGQRLLDHGHKLPIRSGSINGTAAFNKKPVLVPDTEIDPIFRKNLLLPDTRSEMAVPLLMGDELLLGVLDLQSDRPNALSEENLSLYDSLAGQLAVAINNAYLLRQTEQARAEMERYVKLVIHEGWSDYLDGIEQKERIGVRYDLNSLEEYDGPIMAAAGNKVLQVPITVANTAIGTIQLEAGDDQEWTEETRALVTAVARQVGQQAENLRLLVETDRYRHEAEQAVQHLRGEAWRDYLVDNQGAGQGFIYDRQQVRPISEAEKMENGRTDKTIHHPLEVQGEAFGELIIEGIDSPEVREFAGTVAVQLSNHLESLRLSAQTASALAQTDLLYQIARALHAADTVDDILQAVVQPFLKVGINEASLNYIDVDSAGKPEWSEMAANWRQKGEGALGGTRFYLPEHPMATLFMSDSEQVQLIADVTNDERVGKDLKDLLLQSGHRAMAFIPLIATGQWVGFLSYSWIKPHLFSRQEEATLSALTSLLTPAAQSLRLFARTKNQAEKDRVVNVITQRIQSTVTIESALETAITELGKALHSRHTQAELSLGTRAAQES